MNTPRSRSGPRRGRGFTIVELLVVVGIVGLMVGLLLPALAGVKRRAAKGEETDAIRQVGIAWVAYANANKDGVLPGYLSSAAQADWRVSYRYPDDSLIPPAPDYGDDMTGVESNIAGPWSWRLLSYLDFKSDILLGHRDADSLDPNQMKEQAELIRSEPAFAYNGLHMGGWWDSGRSYRFSSSVVHETDEAVSVVSRSLGTIRRSSSMITFTAAAPRSVGLHKYERGIDDFDATFLVMPPNYMYVDVWGESIPRDRVDGNGEMTARVGGDPYTIEYYGADSAPDGSIPFG